MLKQHLLFLRIRILPTYHLKGHRPISLQIWPCWLRIRLSNLTQKWFLGCLLVHILLKNVPVNKKPTTTKKTEPSYFMCEELCVRSPVTPKPRKMVLCSVNLLEFQKRNELEFQTQSDLSELRLSFRNRSPLKLERIRSLGSFHFLPISERS